LVSARLRISFGILWLSFGKHSGLVGATGLSNEKKTDSFFFFPLLTTDFWLKTLSELGNPPALAGDVGFLG
jgi:hypothetical protein